MKLNTFNYWHCTLLSIHCTALLPCT